jgi:hypothetical protein
LTGQEAGIVTGTIDHFTAGAVRIRLGYCTFLAQYHRADDAILVAKTSVKLDPDNQQLKGLVNNLENIKSQAK